MAQIFVSCGQVTPTERKLGEDVCALIRALTPHEPYFAQQQNSLQAFTTNILGRLDDSVALIVIMHPRGAVKFPDGSEHIRASVWIEQEIGIAAYMVQILGRPLQIAPYIHLDITREGMRDQLPLNAVRFTHDSEVLEHLRVHLPSWNKLPASLKSSRPPKVRVALEHGRASNYLFRFINDSDEEVFITEITLEHNGIRLTEPLRGDTPTSWKLEPHHTGSFGKTIGNQKNPATGLIYMHRNEGLKFDTHMDIIFTCSANGQPHEIRERVYVQVRVTNSEIFSLV
jgi:hypothetical protein